MLKHLHFIKKYLYVKLDKDIGKINLQTNISHEQRKKKNKNFSLLKFSKFASEIHLYAILSKYDVNNTPWTSTVCLRNVRIS